MHCRKFLVAGAEVTWKSTKTSLGNLIFFFLRFIFNLNNIGILEFVQARYVHDS